jgi:hypothetical protein
VIRPRKPHDASIARAAIQIVLGADTGIGMEFFTLTALVVGLGGFVPGRGAVLVFWRSLLWRC